MMKAVFHLCSSVIQTLGNGDDWGVIALVIRETGPAVAPEGPGIAEQIDLE